MEALICGTVDGGVDALLEKAVTQVACVDAERADDELQFLGNAQVARSAGRRLNGWLPLNFDGHSWQMQVAGERKIPKGSLVRREGRTLTAWSIISANGVGCAIGRMDGDEGGGSRVVNIASYHSFIGCTNCCLIETA